MRYVGLTDHPERRKEEHGDPSDFKIVRKFPSESAARKWEKSLLAQGYNGDTGGAGWQYGYTFSNTSRTLRRKRK
jgi:hypothetical protein